MNNDNTPGLTKKYPAGKFRSAKTKPKKEKAQRKMDVANRKQLLTEAKRTNVASQKKEL